MPVTQRKAIPLPMCMWLACVEGRGWCGELGTLTATATYCDWCAVGGVVKIQLCGILDPAARIAHWAADPVQHADGEIDPRFVAE